MRVLFSRLPHRFVLFVALAVLFVAYLLPLSTSAAVNRQINFQGKIVNKTGGTNITNGTYNMQFKIYSGGDGVVGGGDETLLWTESRLRNSSQGVVITDGVFQVNLGSVTALPGSVDFNNSTLWLSMEMGDTAASCTPFASCTPDGEMSPMVRFTSSPYSFNSDLLDGIDSAAFGQLAASQTWTGTNTLQPTTNISSLIVKQTSAVSPTADIMKVTTANGTNNVIQVTGPAANEAAIVMQSFGTGRDITLTSADQIILNATTGGVQVNGTLTVGTSDTTGTLFVLDTKTGSGDPTGIQGAMYYNSNSHKFRCYEGATGSGTWKDCIGGGVASLGNTDEFADDTNETLADSNTSVWDGTLPNITPTSTSNAVMVSVWIGLLSGSADEFEQNSFTIRRAVGSDPTCTSTQVGRTIAIDTQSAYSAVPYTQSVTFRDTPASTGNVRYIICSNTASFADGNGVDNTTNGITFTLEEIGG